MDITDAYCHTCTCKVAAPAEEAFAYMSDGMKQGEWTFGSWNRKQVGENMFIGTSMFDNKDTYIKIDADPVRFIICYHIGPDPEHLQARNMVRVVSGPDIGQDPGLCLVTLLAWRSSFMNDARWKQLCVSHETQMFIIKSRIEANNDGS
ncbi:MAG: hypothetical protein ACE5GZ_13870 [Gammaproteobacteria bacterium]